MSAVANADVAVTACPASLTVGVPFSASFLVRNTGTVSLEPTLNFRLGSQQPQDTARWGRNRVELPASVPAGGSKEFTVDGFVPQEAGTFQFAWLTLQEGVRWFGRITQSIQTVVAPDPHGNTIAPTTDATAGLLTSPAPVSRWPGPYQGGGPSSTLILNTGPLNADRKVWQANAKNDTNRTVWVTKVDDWLGVSMGGRCDTQIYAERSSDGSFLFLSPRDHYADAGQGNFRSHLMPGNGFALAPGDSLQFVFFANGFTAGAQFHYQTVLHYEG